MMLTVGSLFAGIGGFDLGFERCGMQTVWQVEQNDFCRAVLARHFPDAQRFVDVRDVGVHNLAPVDLICGGFPCQDISLAGKGAGIDGARSGLWSEFARIIGELGPRYVVVENVPAIRSRGLDRVLRDLAALGYDAEWDCVPASALGAPHQRDRFWLVAYPNADGEELRSDLTLRDGWEVRAALGGVCAAPHGVADADLARSQGAKSEQARRGTGPADGGPLADPARHAEARAASTAGAERQRARPGGQRGRAAAADAAGQRCRSGRPGGPAGGGEVGEALPSQGMADPQCRRRQRGEDQQRRDDSLGQTTVGGEGAEDAQGGDQGGRSEADRLPASEGWGVEPNVGRVADGVPARVDRLSSLGNALVPQIAEWIGQRILDFEATDNAR